MKKSKQSSRKKSRNVEPPAQAGIGDGSLLTAMQLKFVEYWYGDSTKAAGLAGFAHPNQAANKLLKIPRVAKAIEAKQEHILNKSAERLREAVSDVSDQEVVDGLRQLGHLPASATKGNITGQVKAWEALARIKGLLVDQTLDLNELLRNTTPEQQDFIAIYGHIPSDEELAAFRASRSGGSA